jgi:hypothetical protein
VRLLAPRLSILLPSAISRKVVCSGSELQGKRWRAVAAFYFVGIAVAGEARLIADWQEPESLLLSQG